MSTMTSPVFIAIIAALLSVMGAQRSVLNSIRARKCTDIAQTNICSSAYLR